MHVSINGTDRLLLPFLCYLPDIRNDFGKQDQLADPRLAPNLPIRFAGRSFRCGTVTHQRSCNHLEIADPESRHESSEGDGDAKLLGQRGIFGGCCQ